MTTQEIDLDALTGRKVKMVVNLDKANDEGHMADEIEGTIEIVNSAMGALIIKPRGATMTRLVEIKNIEPGSVVPIVDKPRELKARRFDPVSVANARQHLLERHEFQLKAINKMTDEEAWLAHKDIDHSNLGHFHAEKSETQAEGADA